MLSYQEYIEKISEGLINTYDINKCKKFLTSKLNKLNVNFKFIDIKSKFKYKLTIFNTNNISIDILKEIVNFNIYPLGYYPSYIYVIKNNRVNSYNYNEKYLSNEYTEITITFKAKYEDSLLKNKNDADLPNTFYHLSKNIKKNKEKIKKFGLMPKSDNRNSVHPERIYIFKNINDLNSLLNKLKFNDLFKFGEAFSYDLHEITLPDSFVIHKDSDMENGFFTCENIPKNI